MAEERNTKHSLSTKAMIDFWKLWESNKKNVQHPGEASSLMEKEVAEFQEKCFDILTDLLPSPTPQLREAPQGAAWPSC